MLAEPDWFGNQADSAGWPFAAMENQLLEFKNFLSYT